MVFCVGIVGYGEMLAFVMGVCVMGEAKHLELGHAPWLGFLG